MKRPRAWLRMVIPGVQAVYAQDCPTAILLGRWAHLYNMGFDDWFVVTEILPYNLGDGPLWINRKMTKIESISLREWVRLTGWRGVLEIIEDLVGLRLCRVCGWLRWMRIPWIRRWERIDEVQAPEFETRYERPRIGAPTNE